MAQGETRRDRVITLLRGTPGISGVRPLAEADDAAARDRERAAGRELLGQKKPPAEVAQLVVDAIRANQFWIFTDDQFAPVVAERHRSIESVTNPPKARTLVDYLLA